MQDSFALVRIPGVKDVRVYASNNLVGRKQIQIITGTVIIRNKKTEVIPAFGQLTLTADGITYVSPVGRGGEFCFQNISSGQYSATVEYGDQTCTFLLQIGTGKETAVKLGRFVCTIEGARP